MWKMIVTVDETGKTWSENILYEGNDGRWIVISDETDKEKSMEFAVIMINHLNNISDVTRKVLKVYKKN